MEEKGTSLHICVPITSFDWAIACTLAQTFSLNLISWILTCTQHEHYKRKKENQWVCGVGDWRFGSAAKADSWAVHTAQLHMSTHICTHTHTLAHAHTRARARTSKHRTCAEAKRRDGNNVFNSRAAMESRGVCTYCWSRTVADISDGWHKWSQHKGEYDDPRVHLWMNDFFFY